MRDVVDQPPDVEVVRSSYDRVADNYVAMGMGDLAPHPWLRAALSAFAEEVRQLGPVLDVGCGPGTVTAYLAGLGVPVSGADLSPRMIDHARRRNPGLDFAVASATDLRLAGESLGGILGWWSLFNLPRDVLPNVLASFARALVPGGHVWSALMSVTARFTTLTPTAGYRSPGRRFSGGPKSFPRSSVRQGWSQWSTFGFPRSTAAAHRSSWAPAAPSDRRLPPFRTRDTGAQRAKGS